MQLVYQTLNPLDYAWQLINGVHVPVWYNSLRLPNEEEISHHHEACWKRLLAGWSGCWKRLLAGSESLFAFSCSF